MKGRWGAFSQKHFDMEINSKVLQPGLLILLPRLPPPRIHDYKGTESLSGKAEPWLEEVGRAMLMDRAWNGGCLAKGAHIPSLNRAISNIQPFFWIYFLFTSSWFTIYIWTSQVAHMVGKLPSNAGHVKRHRFNPWISKIPWRKEWQPTLVFLPGNPPWTEEPGGLQSKGSHRVRHNWSNLVCICIYIYVCIYTYICIWYKHI